MRKNISDVLRIAVKERLNSGESINAIAKAAQLDHAQLGRFLVGERLLRSDAIDRLADLLGMELRKR
jgi:hypothetical protein